MFQDRLVTRYFKLYSLQYVCIGVCLFFFFYSEFILVPRTNRVKFKLDDSSISKSYVADEVVSGAECIGISVLVSTFVVVVHCLVGDLSLKKVKDTSSNKNDPNWLTSRPRSISKQMHLLHLSLVCLGLILTINGVITNSLKLFIGNLRPDFLERCQPMIPKGQEKEYYNLDVCKQANKGILHEGLKSTPSGHSSFISSGMGFIFLWQCYFVNGNKVRHLWCVVLAVVVMISRLTDHRHHWYDVLFGSSIGLATVFLCWRWVFVNKQFGKSPLGV
ncbi:hypothetical protein Kpol_2000p87 [Vanderwaltozyma polyspora DSM 70294]|uniref:Phosphatidic acid phosphatase type 2/haloperoxidase domain-containing protein n=1 Tax=Vanderwaltozyma polyspora (strain ATCC 22028 / DSM 70294 / BCRC 21397 / CBS 2163 / NBRC 10782 / NRRL Y-8283 / UCD 57-17) TaxID=436907 RepID=A7TF94_VANPO|nr:uncharacterized protein Kpol_2000p87 [Vanderwaltozyma polyspora DSM 70294]EDO19119.1 hypothetical protein Kpol_2000p87 [Vanderwaltozyma polyspora DSM 70294]